MHRLLRIDNEQGYTLIESLFQLIVYAAFLQLVILFFFWKAPIERQYKPIGNTDWEMFVLDMQEALIDVSEFGVHPNNRGIKIRTERGVIDIEQNTHVIRKKVDGTGHVPFLTDIKTAHFERHGIKLIIDVTMLDGTRKERDFVVGLRPE